MSSIDLSKEIAEVKVLMTGFKSLNKEIDATLLKTKEDLKLINSNDVKTIADLAEVQGSLNGLLQKKNDISKEQIKNTKRLEDLNTKAAKALVEEEKVEQQRQKTLAEFVKKQQQITKLRVEEDKVVQQNIKTKEQSLKLSIAERKEAERLEKAKKSQLLAEEKQQKQLQATLLKEKEQNTIYVKKSKTLNQLRKNYKNLVLEEGKSTKETRKLLKEIKKLDKELKDVDGSVGQFQRNVGNYPKIVDKAKSSLDGLKGALIGVASVASIKMSLDSSSEGSESVREVTAQVSASLDVAKNTAASFFLDFKDGITNAVDSYQKGGGFIDSVKQVGKGYDRTAESTKDFGEKLARVNALAKEYAQAQIQSEKASRVLQVSIADLNKDLQTQLLIQSDSTNSFKEIEDASLQAAKVQSKISDQQIKLAQENLDLIQKEIEIKKASDLGAGVELLDKETEALVNLKNARTEAMVALAEIGKVRRENARDSFEKDLDYAIDAFDNQKTVNERIISDQRRTFDTRRSLLDETEVLAQKSFENQIKLVEGYTNKKIDLDNLAKESDEEVIRTKLRSYNFDEITLTRILEIIKERKLAVQDLADANRDLNESETNGIEIRNRIIEQQEFLNDATLENSEQLESDLEELEIKALEDRIANLKEGSEERLNLQYELNEKLIDIERERINQEQELADKAEAEKIKSDQDELNRKKANQEALIQLGEQVTDKLIEQQNRVSEAKQKDLQDGISNAEKEQDRLFSIANSGNSQASQLAAKRIQDEKENARKLKEELEDEKNKQIQNQAFLTGLKLLGSRAGQQNAVPKTLGDVSALAGSILSVLPSYKDGIAMTSSKGLGVDGEGGFHAILHDKERVMDQENNLKTGGLSNSEVANITQDFLKGNLVDKSELSQLPAIQVKRFDTNDKIISKLDDLKHSIENQKYPRHTLEFDVIEGILNHKIKTANSISNQKRRVN